MTQPTLTTGGQQPHYRHQGPGAELRDRHPRELADRPHISGLLASAAAATAAFANPVPYGDGGTIPIAPAPAAVRVISTGGMAGWQVALIAAGAALAAAAAAVLLDRKLAGHRRVTATTA